ncbi:alpha/beta hydrolase [Ferruginibacter albus]|uniref:alpha/beta hydrolase n=1 Tax=Ferruginibacter albus TaxID=2875540 RepID=UPI001CC7A181|nr:alpha/beta hydrolase [Ferruginibacter albus]UAY51905.1 lysophospholipase [Ferruginibacter albus]
MKRLFKYLIRTFIVLFILVNVVMAFNAYKFTHFYDAQTETASKKIEDKSKWDIIKGALFGINYSKKPNSIIPDLTFKIIHVKTKDSIDLEGWYLKTDSVAKGTVLLFHGHGANKSDVMEEAQEFLAMGYNAFLIDFRAHGSSGGNTCTIGYYESEDVSLAYNYIVNKGEHNIILWGISMGAAAIIKAVHDTGVHPQKIILEMPYGSLLQAAEGRLKIMHLPPEPLSGILCFWGGLEHGFWAFNMRPDEYAVKIDCPVLLQWGKQDPRVSEQEINDIYAAIPAGKRLVVYDSCAHESLCAKENAKWKREIKTFLLQ